MPTAVVYEIIMMLMVMCVVLAIPSVEKYGRNIRMTLIIDHTPQRFRYFFSNIISPAFGLVYCYILISRGFVAGLNSISISETTGSSWDVPIYWLKIIVPVAFCLLFIVLAAELINGIIQISKKKTVTNQNKGQALLTD
jgi:TRAP-type C4-dicarboxylate transport system permease small subunit